MTYKSRVHVLKHSLFVTIRWNIFIMGDTAQLRQHGFDACAHERLSTKPTSKFARKLGIDKCNLVY